MLTHVKDVKRSFIYDQQGFIPSKMLEKELNISPLEIILFKIVIQGD